MKNPPTMLSNVLPLSQPWKLWFLLFLAHFVKEFEFSYAMPLKLSQKWEEK